MHQNLDAKRTRSAAARVAQANKLIHLWPFTELLHNLKSFGGYPFTVDIEHEEVTVIRGVEYIKLAIMVAIQILPHTSIGMLTVIETGSWDLGFVLENTDITLMDYVTYNVNSVLSTLTTITIFVVCVRKRLTIRDLYWHMTSVAVKLRGQECNLGNHRGIRKVKMCIVIALSLNLVAATLYAASQYMVYKDQYGKVGDWAIWFYTAVAFLSNWTIFSPIMWGSVMMVTDQARAFNKIVEEWVAGVSKIEVTKGGRVKGDLSADIEWCYEVSNDIGRLGNKLREIVSPFLLTTYSAVVFFCITFFYGSLSPVFGLSGDASFYLYSASTLTMGALFFLGLYLSSGVGQDLTNTRQQAVRCLEDLGMRVYGHLDTQERMGLEIATSRLEGRVICLSPYNLFDVTNSSFVGVLSTSVTYLIILLQFRVS